MSLRDLLTKRPSGEYRVEILGIDTDLDFEITTSIDALLPDLQANTPNADSFPGDQRGPPVDVSFEIEIDALPNPDIPLTLPNTPNDILFGFGGDNVINGDAGGSPDDPGNDTFLGIVLPLTMQVLTVMTSSTVREEMTLFSAAGLAT